MFMDFTVSNFFITLYSVILFTRALVLSFFLSSVIDECQNKYGNANAWKYCCRVFDLLTVAAVSMKDFSQNFTISYYIFT